MIFVVVVVEYSVVDFFMVKPKYAGFSLPMEIVLSLPFMVSLKYLGSVFQLPGMVRSKQDIEVF